MKTKRLTHLLSMLLLAAFLTSPLRAAEASTDRQKKMAEISRLDAELKPLRIRAAREADVIAARKKVDDALRYYYEALRLKMAELEPRKKKKIERQVQLRKDVYNGSAGSRAEDYMAAAAKAKSAPVAKTTP